MEYLAFMFAAGSIWALLPILLVSAIIIWDTEYGEIRGIVSAISLGVSIFLFSQLGSGWFGENSGWIGSAIQFVASLPWYLLVPVYVIIGVCYMALLRWPEFIAREKRELSPAQINMARENFLEVEVNYAKTVKDGTGHFSSKSYALGADNLIIIPPEHKEAWQAYAAKNLLPQPARYKSMLTSWGLYWPWSFVWWALGSLPRRIWRQILRWSDALLQRVNVMYAKDL